MKKLSKVLKILGVVCLIILASFGVGMGGAAPILPKNRARFIDTLPKTELVESTKNNLNPTAAADELKS